MFQKDFRSETSMENSQRASDQQQIQPTRTDEQSTCSIGNIDRRIQPMRLCVRGVQVQHVEES
ncbi:hypothetical protein BPOR_0135g00140 [Botrytis porri]|uniref:Uncharacterized protein n=1 Tax=Botrytis porri TaxID=87229 RepID=A0A4Z1KWK1_9HELO|nr:hypothetical protein BPOR_0135g00140 [Botrytis porri]